MNNIYVCGLVGYRKIGCGQMRNQMMDDDQFHKLGNKSSPNILVSLMNRNVSTVGDLHEGMDE
jgi:hypothetical protein